MHKMEVVNLLKLTNVFYSTGHKLLCCLHSLLDEKSNFSKGLENIVYSCNFSPTKFTESLKSIQGSPGPFTPR